MMCKGGQVSSIILLNQYFWVIAGQYGTRWDISGGGGGNLSVCINH